MNRLALTTITRQNKSFIGEILLDENRNFLDFQLYESEESTMMNHIYVARVEDIVKNIHAAFVRVSKDMKCYLPLDDLVAPIYTKKLSKSKELCVGDELLVQVIRDAVKTKDPVVTTKLTIHGKGVLLTTENCSIGISSKITGEKRQELSDWLNDVVKSQWPESTLEDNGRDFGLLLRTIAGDMELSDLQQDIMDTIYCFQKIKESAVHLSAFSLMYQEAPAYISRIKSLQQGEIDQVLTDSQEIYDQIIRQIPNVSEKCNLYTDEAISLNRLYKIDTTLDELLDKRVWLKSGANIIIEQLETLTFIDVNTAKNQSKKSDAILAVNLEAASEVARQLRLRNISGMILVDFINMTAEDEEKLMHHLKAELKKDTVSCHFIDFTKLGLAEITRKKVYRSLKEIVAK